ncbi:uncharacterized protein LOC105162338 [Sesamum indicum]|uniref:Uncharacterized protein LOC105162338 n=1 Tax=Sesamum indicum TaxID=4182 RepID=A0A6I9T4B0_SESIN|nr:uncharacterized protein LOC105162338 [Sesamum indicum]
MKIDFVDGTAVRPTANTDEFKRWNRIDSMVTTWILNCMTKDLAESFMYVRSARKLWIELEARYGESSNPMIYQLQREIGQDNVYDQARSQILLLEPLPTVTKAYSMMIRIEKQMNLNNIELNSGAVFNVKGYNYKKKPVVDRRHVICEHCQRTGHTKESCFKLNGIPDWYKDLADQRKKAGAKGRGYSAMVSDEPNLKVTDSNYPNLTELVRLEMKKLMNEDTPSDPLRINFAQLDNFAGNSTISTSVISSTWIIDSGATNHICADISLFDSYTKLTNPPVIHLLNGHSQKVSHIGSVQVTSKIKLSHDLKTEKVLATAYLIRNLYILESSFVSETHDSLKSVCSSHSCISDEPRNYKEVAVVPHWVEAMKLELAALERNQTWKVVPLPAGKNPIGCKWVFKTKLREDGSVERHKARLVAKGYTQVEGVDYNERFSPVAKCVTRSLYGLRQASRQWNTEFTRCLEKFGFKQSSNDHYLFFKTLYVGFIGLIIYVDDVLINDPSLDDNSQVKSYLDGLFTIKDLGCARFFLGLQIARSESGISLTQSKYIHDIINDCGLQNSKPAATPLPPGIKLQTTSGENLVDPERYRRLDALVLDFSSHLQILCNFKRFVMPTGVLVLTLCSLTGFAVFLGSALVSWKTKKQCTISRSSAEAEYRSMAATTCELQWISYLLKDFGVSVTLPIPFHCDNQAAIHIMANPVFHKRTKHLDIDYHIVRNCYKDGFLLPIFVRSRNQVADLFTKSLCSASFNSLLGRLGLFAVDPCPTCGGGVLEIQRKLEEQK